ncbi:MAG: helicase-exonuclease AddAB subunit AddA [Lachnospiraceae bacterium]|nr:helicase-exonuclease AddAB subunit AddA [Lachnospiraceae bacterium]
MKTAIKWTADQASVIESRLENLLVSAAAGAGKTAVLVARLMAQLEDPEDPANIDEFLIVTFTRAAAGQMKDKIREKISERLDENPENSHMQKQLMLLNRAKINTIDGFCSYVVRNYAGRVDFDPGFRMGETGELKLMQKDVMDALLEQAFADEDEDFRKRFTTLADVFADKRDEDSLESWIVRIYEKAQSDPYPEEWYEACLTNETAMTLEDIADEPWMKQLMARIDETVQEGQAAADYLATYQGDSSLTKSCAEATVFYPDLYAKLSAAKDSYEALFTTVQNVAFPRVSTGKKMDPEAEAAFKNAVNVAKGCVNTLKNSLLTWAPELAAQVCGKAAATANTLLELARRFGTAYEVAKRKKNVADFSDVAHGALRILRDEHKQRTDAAKELAARFREVMIDEYQDSNYLQEELLTAVSRIEEGVNNYFCVGDVKQSIYSFRNARPELFMDKFDHYGVGGTNDRGHRIDLHQNFRSRPEILAFVNEVCRDTMRREVGGIDYDSSADLIFDEARREDMPCLLDETGKPDTSADVLLVRLGDEADDDDDAPDKLGREIMAIARKIRHLVDHCQIRAKDGSTRPVAYRDIAILVRKIKDVSDLYVRLLGAAGIPAVTTEKEGLFDVPEVRRILDYLMVLDNPRQDIPLAAVMCSPAGRFTPEELALIRSCPMSGFDCPEEADDTLNERLHPTALCDWCQFYLENGSDERLKQKLRLFFERLDDYRQLEKITPLHELIERILSETGLRDYAAALPDGQKRLQNLQMVVEKAIDYEDTSYVGLFNFVRYIDNLKKYNVDLEAGVTADSEDAVRIVTIHKSKGLEYPIVFLARMGAKLNKRANSKAVLLHNTLGIAADYVEPDNRRRLTPMKKVMMQAVANDEFIGEELRVLYVALTRAQIKLYVTGVLKADKNGNILSDKYETERESIGGADSPIFMENDVSADETVILREERLTLPTAYLSKIDLYYDMIMPTALRLQEANSPLVRVEEIGLEDLAEKTLAEETDFAQHFKAVFEHKADEVTDPAVRDALEKKLSFVYAYGDRREIPAKVSVSDIKHERMEDEEAESKYRLPEVVPYLPDFIKEMRESEKEGPTGAEIGTAVHNLLAYLDLKSLAELSFTMGDELPCTEAEHETVFDMVQSALMAAVAKGLVAEGPDRYVNRKKIVTFLESPLGRRMIRADQAGALRREQPFTMRVPASWIEDDWTADEEVLVQGIIDVYFEEEGKIILLDYKTDRVPDAEALIRRYKAQLLIYAEALERATGLPVAEIHMYAMALEEDVVIARS